MKNEATIPGPIAVPKFSDLPDGTVVWCENNLYIKTELGTNNFNCVNLNSGTMALINSIHNWFRAAVKIVDDPQVFDA